MRVKKIFWLYLLLLIIDMAVIFCFSGQSGESSTEMSKGISDNVVEHIVGVKESKAEAIKQYAFAELLIRKSAHIVLYGTLGIFAFLMFKSSGYVNNILYLFVFSMVLCILYAVSDEFHQTFVSNRSGNVIDVLIDACGSLAGIFVVWFATKKFSFCIK